jgi:hypothetical protein
MLKKGVFYKHFFVVWYFISRDNKIKIKKHAKSILLIGLYLYIIKHQTQYFKDTVVA